MSKNNKNMRQTHRLKQDLAARRAARFRTEQSAPPQPAPTPNVTQARPQGKTAADELQKHTPPKAAEPTTGEGGGRCGLGPAGPSAEQAPGQLLATYEQVATMLSLSAKTLRRMVQDKTFPAPVKLAPRRVRFALGEVNAWVAERIHNR